MEKTEILARMELIRPGLLVHVVVSVLLDSLGVIARQQYVLLGRVGVSVKMEELLQEHHQMLVFVSAQLNGQVITAKKQ